MNTVDFVPLTMDKGGGGGLLHAEDGFYMDFHTDTGTSSLGYCSEEERRVLKRLYDEQIPVHGPNIFLFKERERAAKRVCEVSGFPRVFFSNSGSETVETALKLARKTAKKRGKGSEVFGVVGGFHGRTLAALAAGDGPPYHHDGFGPLPAGFSKFENIESIHPNAAAVILAPVYGANDVRVYPDGWLQELREYTEANGILLIFDEVQTGAGRSGGFTYAKKIGVQPDILCMAKGIAMGTPAAVTLATEEVAEAFTPGAHFSTFGGSPMTCAFMNGMIDWLEEPGQYETIEQKGHFLRESMSKLDWVRKIRGTGLMFACDIDLDLARLTEGCRARRLLIASWRKGILKLSPTLNITFGEITSAVAKLNETALSLG
jgi:acetylornithine/succinyldiaminopimelate/putrescine aminotransferase